MNLALLTAAVCLTRAFFASSADLPADPLARWQAPRRIRPVSPHENRHSLHAYFNTCPESPDGRHVLYYTSPTATGEEGDIRILERATGIETILATDIRTEDAHRSACQHWVNHGRNIVYHNRIGERWFVMSIDVATKKQTVLAEDRQLGFGSPDRPWVPVYGCHWNPGPHRNLELIHAQTGQVTTPVTIAQVVEQYREWIDQRFASTDLSIFFPVMSPDGSRVMFKIAKPGGGNDFRGMNVSTRDGNVVFDLDQNRLIRLLERWGHPSWSPQSDAILEHGLNLINLATGDKRKLCPSSPANHQTISPDGRLFLTDAQTHKLTWGKPGEWAVIVGDVNEDRFVIVDRFNHEGGATSWRSVHPHPVFTRDGQRIYYNVNTGPWSRLFVAEPAAE